MHRKFQLSRSVIRSRSREESKSSIFFETTSIPKIVINPCMFPSIEIPKLTTISDDLIKKWERYGKFLLKAY